MSFRLLTGILCIILGLVFIATSHAVKHRVTHVEVKEQVHWITAKIQSVDSVQKVETPPRPSRYSNGSELNYFYVADLSFNTKDGKTIKVHKTMPFYLLGDLPLAIQYREDDPTQTLEPTREGLDAHGDKVVDDSKIIPTDAERAEADKDARESTASWLAAAGVCVGFWGALMVYAAFKN